MVIIDLTHVNTYKCLPQNRLIDIRVWAFQRLRNKSQSGPYRLAACAWAIDL